MGTLARLLRQVRPYWPRVSLALLVMTVATALVTVQPAIIRFVVDSIYEGGQWEWLAPAAIGIFLVAVLKAALNYWERMLMEWVSQRTIYDLRNSMYSKLQQLSFSFYDKAQTGQLMSRATADIEMLRRFLSFGILRLVSSFLTMGFVVAFLLLRSPLLTLLSMSTMPFLVAVIYIFATRIRPRYRLIQQQMATMTSVLQEGISGVRVVKAFAQEEREIERFRRENWDYLDQNVTTVRLWAFFFPLMAFLGGVGGAIVLWFGGNMVMTGEISLGDLLAFQALLAQLIMPVRMVGWLVNMATQAGAAGQRVFEILDTESEVKEKPGARVLRDCSGAVSLKNVSFSYDGVNMVLTDVTIDAPPGKSVAILGATGSGKSSIINLIPRFYDVSAGSISIDSNDIRDFTLQSLRSHIAIVSQETFLFSTTIRDNIAYGKPDATDEEVVAAAKAAQIHDFIITLPEGYQSKVGERGIGLSGGQKQRVAIARALLTNSRILILDEAMSSVDVETEYLIQLALAELMKNRTTFVIAQRLSTVMGADEIVILKDGVIKERGTHALLYSISEDYRDIVHLQLQRPESEMDTEKGGGL
ncbi:MAG TPA: ABC transporter ATP-binding protein [Bacillota bacterium]|nr:ABC transporter ATP-binding protein [Bacillota bacterium]